MIDTNQVKKIIKLAKLQIDESQVEKFKMQINDILGLVEMLKEVEVKDTEFLSLPVQNTMREDIVTESLSQELALSNCKNVVKGGFGVPSVLGKST